MKKYEVTYKVAGCKYECSYIVLADNAELALKLADAWAKTESTARHTHISTKQVIEVPA